MNLFKFILFIPFFYIYDKGLFYLTEKKYCKKYKGICENCKCWSCEKYNQIIKKKEGKK